MACMSGPIRLLVLALAVALLGLPSAAPAAANADDLGRFDAVVLVSESDLPELLASWYLADFAVVTPTDLGWEDTIIRDTELFGEYTVLTPSMLGLDQPNQLFGGIRIAPFWAGFAPIQIRFGVPIFRFRPPLVAPPAALLGFPRVVIVVGSPPPPPVLSLPPPLPPLPPPLPPHPPAPPAALAPPAPGTTMPLVPIIPEADSLLLLAGGLAALGVLAALRRGRSAGDPSRTSR